MRFTSLSILLPMCFALQALHAQMIGDKYIGKLASYEAIVTSFCASSQRQEATVMLGLSGTHLAQRTCQGSTAALDVKVTAPAITEEMEVKRNAFGSLYLELSTPITTAVEGKYTLTSADNPPQNRGGILLLSFPSADQPPGTTPVGQGTCVSLVENVAGFPAGSQVLNRSRNCRRSPTWGYNFAASGGLQPYRGVWTIFSAAISDSKVPHVTIEVTAIYTFERAKSSDAVPNTAPPPRQPTDTRFVTSSGPGIGTSCLGRSSGPIEIPIEIGRAIGEVEADGRLMFPTTHIVQGVVSKRAALRIASFGRLLQGTSPRRDRVFLNGKEVKPLTGANEQWTGDYLAEVQIEDLLFPARVPGSLPVPRTNKLRIEIDAAGPAGPENWCASVSWAELTFSAMAPIVLVHGNGQGDDDKGGEFWEGGVLDVAGKPRLRMPFAFLEPFKTQLIPYDGSISMKSDTVAVNGGLLAKSIPRAAAEWGAKHAHIVAHSKGGLDSRDFLARTIPANFGVYSIHTVSAPHQGSSGPDYQIDAEGAYASFSDDAARTKIGAEVLRNKGTSNPRVSAAAQFNKDNLRFLPPEQKVDGETHTVQYRSISADMNLDNSTFGATGKPTISFDETEGLPGQGVIDNSQWAFIIQSAYHITGYVVSTRTDFVDKTIPIIGTKVRYKVVRETLTPTFRPNDVAVTRESATVGPFKEIAHVKANHSSIASPSTAQLVLDSIRAIQPLPDPIP